MGCFGRGNRILAMNKICSRCKHSKPFLDFNKRFSSEDGLQRMCRLCEKQYKQLRASQEKARSANWYQRNRELKNQKSREWYLANKDLVINKSLQWLKNNPQKSRLINAKKKAVKLNATPSWADQSIIDGMYEAAEIFRQSGVQMEVDHIIPLRGKTVCGLHTHDNLQLMVRSANAAKSNRVWPDMP